MKNDTINNYILQAKILNTAIKKNVYIYSHNNYNCITSTYKYLITSIKDSYLYFLNGTYAYSNESLSKQEVLIELPFFYSFSAKTDNFNFNFSLNNKAQIKSKNLILIEENIIFDISKDFLFYMEKNPQYFI